MVAAGAVFAIVLRFLYDYLQDSTSHNLLPVELIITGAIALLAAWVGVYSGTFIRKNSRQQEEA
ncbi:MAG: hypothetical protein MUE95_02775 [Cyclobacteriaceae bacterium]|nr:hypothetical protein [Cyclobacteriaceae bacterium]